MRLFSKQGLYCIFFSILSGCLLASESGVLSDLNENGFAIIPGIRHLSLSPVVPVKHVDVLMCQGKSLLKPNQCLEIWLQDVETGANLSYGAFLVTINKAVKCGADAPGSCESTEATFSYYILKPDLQQKKNMIPLGMICRYDSEDIFLGGMTLRNKHTGNILTANTLVESVYDANSYNINFNCNTSHDCQRLLTTDHYCPGEIKSVHRGEFCPQTLNLSHNM
ncbi:MAG: hypothetical protein ACR2PT_18630 [Endozoicomonas sp.]